MQSRQNTARRWRRSPTFLLLLILPLTAWGKSSKHMDWRFSLGYLVLISLLTFACYWHDKRRAQSGGWRVPEKVLHLLGLLGGWPAAHLAQQTLRHKTQKRGFRVVYWLTVSLYQFVALDYLLNWKILGQF